MEQLLNLSLQGSVFTPACCIRYACMKAQGIFPANYPSEPVTLTWDDLFRLGIRFFSPWLFSGCQITYCQSTNRSLTFIAVLGTYLELD